MLDLRAWKSRLLGILPEWKAVLVVALGIIGAIVFLATLPRASDLRAIDSPFGRSLDMDHEFVDVTTDTSDEHFVPAPADDKTYEVAGPAGLVLRIEPYGEQRLAMNDHYFYPHHVDVSQNGGHLSRLELVDGDFNYLDSDFAVSTSSIIFSPSGRYASLNVEGWESLRSFLVDTTTGRDVVGKLLPTDTCAFRVWWVGNDLVVLYGYYCSIDGVGSEGIYIWRPTAPGVLKIVYRTEFAGHIIDPDVRILNAGTIIEFDTKAYNTFGTMSRVATYRYTIQTDTLQSSED